MKSEKGESKNAGKRRQVGKKLTSSLIAPSAARKSEAESSEKDARKAKAIG